MLKNLTKKNIIADKIKICRSIFSKTLGLMFTKPIKDKCLIFVFEKKTKINLHMFFVFYPIDVVFLDKNKKVIEIKENFKPFRIYNSKKKANYVIELPCSSIRQKNIEINDLITFA
ncbi:DUF192 domain-containing protein [Candidatus Woesearchaeota archaeon]|nr:DUF192 domain-containing protein [Candidatus Woesearchaeota archaeon]